MQKVDYIVKSAEITDCEQIAQIEKECFSSPWTINQITEEIKKDNVTFLVAKIDSIVAGYISGQLILDEFYISNIAVKDCYRNKHIGSDILEALIDILKTKNCNFATLEVRESNINARKLYEKYGFECLGIRRDFYSLPKENACIYTFYFENEVNSH